MRDHRPGSPEAAAAMHARISEVFTRAMAAQPAEQQQLIADFRDEDPAAAEELVRWLASAGTLRHGDSGAFLSAPLVELKHLRPGTRAGDESAAVVDQPHTIGRYQVVRQIGRGAFADVFLAEQLRPVRRRVAIKLLVRTSLMSDVLTRFERERHALARLQHPSIASLYDAALHDHQPYFVMEWVDGRPLTEFVRVESLTCTDRLRLFVMLARAVQHAHECGVIHRDLKPSNVLAYRCDGSPAVKVIDFGVAKAIAASSDGPVDERSLHTLPGTLVGTPPYMSPELLDGEAVGADTRCDVYALGALLFEVLTGRRLIDAPGATIADYRRLARERARVKLGQHDTPIRWRRDLEAIVEAAAAPDRAHRYRSAGDLADDLERLMAGEAIRARSMGRFEAASRWVRRHPVGCAVVAVVAVGLIALFSVQSSRLQVAELRAQLLSTALATISSAEALADRIGVDDERAALQRHALSAARDLVRLTPDDPTSLHLLARALRGVQESELAAADRTTGDARRIHQAEVQQLRTEHLAVRRRIASHEEATVEERADVALALVLVGNSLQESALPDDARPLYEEALTIEESLLTEAPDDLLLLSRVCYSYERLGVLATARGDRALECSLAVQRLHTALRLAELASGDRYAGLNLAEARRFMLTLDSPTGTLGPSFPDCAQIATDHIEHCRELVRAHPGCKRSLRELAMGLALVARRLPDADDAPRRIALLTEAESILRRAAGEQPDDRTLVDPLAAVLSDLSQEAEWSGDVDLALARVDEQLMLLRWLNERRPTDAVYHGSIARAERRRHDLLARRSTPLPATHSTAHSSTPPDRPG